jgi:hypothetical protein
MTHPPIPPNCKYFEEVEGECQFHIRFSKFEYTNPDSQFIFCILEDAGPMERPIIAAVARCAWLDEAEKFNAEFYNLCDLEDGNQEQLERGLHLDDVLIPGAYGNAKAWAEWGKQPS